MINKQRSKSLSKCTRRRPLSAGKAVKCIQIKLKVHNACLHSHFPSNGPDLSLCWAVSGPGAFCLIALLQRISGHIQLEGDLRLGQEVNGEVIYFIWLASTLGCIRMNCKHVPGERDVGSTLLTHLPPCPDLDLDKQNMDELSKLNLC